MPDILIVQNLAVNFQNASGRITAVDDISFSLKTSEFLAIVGESGSGKTVTALSVMRLIPAESGMEIQGQVLFLDEDRGQDLLTLSEKELQEIRGRRIAMVFQEPMSSLNPVYTCGNQVSEILIRHNKFTHREAKEKVLSLFEEVLLPRPRELYHAYPHQLSGGQKQRIMIAMAIACNPVLLIADEPTTSLDVTVQKSIMQLLKELQERRKMSILFITHDLGLVAGYADRAMVMLKGRIVEQGPVSQLFRRSKHPYTKGLLACRPRMDAKPRRLPTVQEFLNENNRGVTNIPQPTEHRVKEIGVCEKETILQVNCLSKSYHLTNGSLFRKAGYFDALKPVSFDVNRGETLGIVGESGSGKTTLARTLLELIPPTSGTIFYQGKDITRIHRDQLRKLRKDLQIIFQDPYASLNPRITIGNAITEPMKVHNLFGGDQGRREKAKDLMRKVGLEAIHFNRYPHEFSGGQRQRICIARALAVEPCLVICDESVSALDVSVQAQVLNLLNDLKEEFRLTYIFISHDLAVVKYMADRILVMKDGEVVETGDCEAIYKNPHSSYTRSLLAAFPHTTFSD